MIQLGKYLKGDRTLWIIVILMLLGSIPLTYSAMGKTVFTGISPDYVSPLMKRIVFTIMSIGIIITMQYVSYKTLNKYSAFFYIITILLLAITALAGNEANEAKRSLSLPFLNISFQTSAFAKVAVIMFVSSLLSNEYNDEVKRRKNADKALIATAIVVFLTLPFGLSTTIIIVGSVFTMLVLIRVNRKYILKRLGQFVGAAAGYMIIAEIFKLPFRTSTWGNRISTWWHGFSCNQANAINNQACIAKSAIADGGLFGRGIGDSPLRYVLPEASSDFIYAHIINEMGIITGLIILIFYLIIFYRGIQVAKAMDKTFPMFLALGLTLMITMQAFLNIGVSIGLLPVTGQPLPLISVGGSSMLATSMAIGIIIQISTHSMSNQKAK
ncbi:MAG: FtsW/RodA/SpoVE family cell cycle protein [Bacteroidota bacterium]|nr:FtsW/RodA/SpoVE family cell cycle protein [Bacteroidota bacterium]